MLLMVPSSSSLARIVAGRYADRLGEAYARCKAVRRQPVRAAGPRCWSPVRANVRAFPQRRAGAAVSSSSSDFSPSRGGGFLAFQLPLFAAAQSDQAVFFLLATVGSRVPDAVAAAARGRRAVESR